MPQLGPHISIADERLVSRVLAVREEAFNTWPEYVRELAGSLAAELFLVRYNPFVNPELVRENVGRRLTVSRPTMGDEFADDIQAAVARFWERYDEDQAFKAAMVERLRKFLPERAIGLAPNYRVECATDATDLRIELPMAVLFPETEEQIRAVVALANEMGFGVVPRGGGTGATGGAIPALARTVVLSLSRFKNILSVDAQNMSMCAQSGVITLDAIKAAAAKGLLFSVDPASKAASSLGGNISENSGGPFAFEYGTTIDNVLSFRMVTPTGGLIEVSRRDHPGHKIFPDDECVFDIHDLAGGEPKLVDVIRLKGGDLRGPNLGKDVTNKYLGGLPGLQKEGVDGIITDACFILHPKQAHSRTLCLEFYGRSMHNAMLVIRQVVGLRDTIREQGDKVKISALEEFGPKYVTAIEYKKKSSTYEGDPISVLLLQLDSDHKPELEAAVDEIMSIAQGYDNVDVFKAEDEKTSEIFWRDRHKLSAIAKRTSGFKINEDIVIPLDVIPQFSDFLENLNLIFMAKAYRKALAKVMDLPSVRMDDESIELERELAFNVLKGKLKNADLSDQEFETRIACFFRDLRDRYPKADREIEAVFRDMVQRRIVIANHMHAGDGNCHVNVPVNSNDPEMLAQAHEAVEAVFAEVLRLKGEVSGEHGIGVTKIAFLSPDKIAALKQYKAKVDPKGVLNPGKLTSRTLPAEPYTFSFNRLILDLDKTGLKDRERLIELLRNIQACTRCGKCKQACPMYHPEAGIMQHPRNKNITLGALIEAIYYSQYKDGRPDKGLLAELRRIVEHCTACGKCTAGCPIKIDSAGSALMMRTFLAEKGAGGHPIKNRILEHAAQDPAVRVPKLAKAASLGQRAHNLTVGLVPKKASADRSLLLQGPGPVPDFKNLFDFIGEGNGVIKVPGARGSVFYFPGCGSSLFSRDVSLAAIHLLTCAGYNVAIPPKPVCCGYPLLSAGLLELYKTNRHRALQDIQYAVATAETQDVHPDTILTSCGTCRESLSGFDFKLETGRAYRFADVTQFLAEVLPQLPGESTQAVLHAACHAECGPGPDGSETSLDQALTGLTGSESIPTPYCCGESGLGAMTSPEIYNRLRERKKASLGNALAGQGRKTPVLVGCPSCRIGVKRSLMQMGKHNPVVHVLEHLARRVSGPKWKKALKKSLDKATISHGVIHLDPQCALLESTTAR